jgi:lipoprotein-anchoring transpeptidase ErfK/SrfK
MKIVGQWGGSRSRPTHDSRFGRAARGSHARAMCKLMSVTAFVCGTLLLSGGVGGAATVPAGPSSTLVGSPRVKRSYTLTNARLARWAVVLKSAPAYAKPALTARVLMTLPTLTGDGTQNIVLVLSRVVLDSNQSWYHIRLAILPNGATGWVPQRTLGRLYTVHTHLYVDLVTTTATLERDGVVVFRTIIGVGRAKWPTPRGQFFIRDKLTGFDTPFYGPIAFGTSARSAVLTDWPGGGYIGVHGTDEPQLLPGHVSHGCIRMPNASILKLARLMPVGTPLTIR